MSDELCIKMNEWGVGGCLLQLLEKLVLPRCGEVHVAVDEHAANVFAGQSMLVAAEAAGNERVNYVDVECGPVLRAIEPAAQQKEGKQKEECVGREATGGKSVTARSFGRFE